MTSSASSSGATARDVPRRGEALRWLSAAQALSRRPSGYPDRDCSGLRLPLPAARLDRTATRFPRSPFRPPPTSGRKPPGFLPGPPIVAARHHGSDPDPSLHPLRKEGTMLSLRQRLAREEGFTLIELLVVLLIIGILLAIAIPSYLGFQKKAQQTAAMSDVREAIPDAEAYYSDNSSYAGIPAAACTHLRLGHGAIGPRFARNRDRERRDQRQASASRQSTRPLGARRRARRHGLERGHGFRPCATF